MNLKLQIEERHWKIVCDILKKYPYQFYAFGSRVKRNAKQFSDLDLCYKEEIPGNIMTHIREDFEESNLPYKVDFIDWMRCDKSFKDKIEKDLVKLEL